MEGSVIQGDILNFRELENGDYICKHCSRIAEKKIDMYHCIYDNNKKSKLVTITCKCRNSKPVKIFLDMI